MRPQDEAENVGFALVLTIFSPTDSASHNESVQNAIVTWNSKVTKTYGQNKMWQTRADLFTQFAAAMSPPTVT